MSTSRGGRLGYVPALDGLRGIAIALVVGFHCTGWPFGGPYGVDLFFVLSGFLITSLLLEERARSGRVDLRAFYARRARRLLPAVALMLVAYLLYGAARGRNELAPVAEYGLYIGNVYAVFIHTTDATGLGHLWSLAEEEQFYLVWPPLLLLLMRARRPIFWIAGLLALVAAYRLTLIGNGATMARMYRAPDAHAEGLVLGCLLAFAHRAGFRAREVHGKIAVVLMTPAIILGIWKVLLPAFEIGSACMVAAAVSETELANILGSRPLVWLGRRSYSLYIWHFPILWAFGQDGWPVCLLASVLLASLSYRFVELPLSRRRRGASHEAPALAPAT